MIRIDKNYTLGDYPYAYEIIAAILSAIITLLGSYLIKSTSLVQKYLWYYKFNSLRWGHALTTKGHRRFTFSKNDSINYIEFKTHVMKIIKNLDIDSYKIVEQDKKSLPPLTYILFFSGVTQLENAELTVKPTIDPPDIDNLEPNVCGMDVTLKLKHKWKMIDSIPGKLDRILRTFGQCLEQSIVPLHINWSIPTLEIGPVTHFLRDSYWLQQVAERSTINLTLYDNTKVSLTPSAIFVRKHSKIPNKFKTFDDQFIYYLKQAVASFYSSN